MRKGGKLEIGMTGSITPINDRKTIGTDKKARARGTGTLTHENTKTDQEQK